MELVELTPLRNALVGLPGTSGLSVEQRKRLTIAVELVANPSAVFMDEPTSGMHSCPARTFLSSTLLSSNPQPTHVIVWPVLHQADSYAWIWGISGTAGCAVRRA